MHVGIVACSAEGAALCYRTFCVEGAARFGVHRHPEVSMHTHCLADYMTCIRAGDWDGVAELMLSSVGKLAAAGAELFICPDNTIHQALPLVEPRSPGPWLHIARVVAAAAGDQGLARLGILGTRSLMEGPVYPEALGALGIDSVVPETADRARVDRIIFDELVQGRFEEPARQAMREVIGRLIARGAGGVVLGCTEIPLLVGDGDASVPLFDSTRLLARAALARAAGERP